MRYVINKLNFTEKDYPPLLREIVNPPQHLNYLGTLPPKDAKMIAIVGTRKATSEGKRIAKKIAKKLSAHFIVVSGLALGIDAAAHEGALEGGGKTVAVLANGLSKIYPSSNENLAKKILEKGGSISRKKSNNKRTFCCNCRNRSAGAKRRAGYREECCRARKRGFCNTRTGRPSQLSRLTSPYKKRGAPCCKRRKYSRRSWYRKNSYFPS